MFIDEIDYANQILNKIETAYGEKIRRVVKLKELYDEEAFEITIIFEDYRLLEAEVMLLHFSDELQIVVEGRYF